MPTIPLLKRNLEPAVPQVPKLDRVARPTMDVRNVLAGMSELGKASLHREVDARPFVAAAGSKGEAWGEVLSSAGGALGDVGKTIARTGQTDTENAAGKPATGSGSAAGNADAKSGSQTGWSIGHALGAALKMGGNLFGALAVKLGEVIGVTHLHTLEGDFRAERERQQAAREAAPDSTKYLADAKRGADTLKKRYAELPGAPPEVKQLIGVAIEKFANESQADAAVAQVKRQVAQADAAMVANQIAALSGGDYQKAREIEHLRLRLGSSTLEESMRSLKLVDRSQREDLLKAAPDEFKAMLEGDPGELPDFMRDIPTEEMAGYGARIPIMQAERRKELIKGITGQSNAGTLAFASDIDSLLSSGKPGAEMSLPEADVAALKRRLQPELINDPADFVSAKARVLNFDHTRFGDLGAANLESDIMLNFSGDQEDHLLAALEKQLKSTRGVSTRDHMQLAQADLFGQVDQYLRDGFFGDDLSRQGEAAARAMAMMQTLDKNASSGKYANPQEMMDDFGSMMKGPAKERARRVIEGKVGGGLDGQSLSGEQRRTVGAGGGSAAANGLSDDRSELLAWIKEKLPPEGSVLVADSPDALAQMLADGVDFPIYTKRIGGEYDPRPAQSDPRPVPPRKNDVNAPRREDRFTGGAYTGRLLQLEATKRRAAKEKEWEERITNDPGSLANEEMLETALTDFGHGDISNQTLDRAFSVGGAQVKGTEFYLRRKAHAAEIENRVLNDLEIGTSIGEIPDSIIKPYEGEFPSPLPVTWYAPKDAGELFKTWIPASEIRGWIDDAAKYQGISPLFAAVILQQENGPNATTTQKVLQFGERSATTFLGIADEVLFDLVPDKLFGKSFADGSSGIPNLQRTTLRSAADYSEATLTRPPLPDTVRNRIFGLDQDTRIPGDDIRADIYYQAAHIRQLIDHVTGKVNFQGEISLDQARRVFKAYNGPGKAAEKYADDAMAKLQKAATGQGNLYFFQPREQK